MVVADNLTDPEVIDRPYDYFGHLSETEPVFDILLGLKTQESRAVGVSGLQPWMPPLCGNPFNPVVVVGGCLVMPSDRYS